MTSGQEHKRSMFRRVITIFKDRFGVGDSSSAPAANSANGNTTSTTAHGTIDFSAMAAPVAVLEGTLARVEQHAQDQITSKAQISTDVRGVEPLRAKLFVHLRSIGGVAATLKSQVPGISILKPPAHATRAGRLITEAESFAQNAQIYQTALIEHGQPSDFVAQLIAATEDYKAAMAAAGNSRAAQRGATAGLESEIALGERTVRQIDANMKRLLHNAPADLAAWKSARRVTHATGGSAAPSPVIGQVAPVTPSATPPATSPTITEATKAA